MYVWKATPGQYFLKVKLEFGEGNSLVFIRAFFRQLLGNLAFVVLIFSGYLTAIKPTPYFALIFTVLGLSYLSYMTSRKRRTFYDQVTDVGVVTLKTEKSFFDFEIEFRYWQSLVATLAIFAGVLLVAVIVGNYDRVLQRTVSFAKLQNEGFFCEEMNQVPDNERLGTAIALNLVNQLSDGCLDRESDFVLWRQKTGDYSLAYYAKSLTTASDEKEKQYLQRACTGENLLAAQVSTGCRIATAFLTKDFDTLYSHLGEPSVLNDIIKYQVSLALNNTADAEKNLAALEKHGTLRAVKKFQVMEMISGLALPTAGGRSPASADQEQEEPNAKLLKLVEEL